MKKALVLILTLLFATAAFGQTSVFFEGSFDDAMKKASTDGKLILIDFFQYG